MKQTSFTTEERTLLQKLLKKRLGYYNKYEQASMDKAGKKRFENFYIKPLVSANDKISSQDAVIYNSQEKLVFISCINENYDNFYNELNLLTAFSWLTISDEQRKVIAKLDNCKDILLKCGYNKKKHSYIRYNTSFRYSNILTVVEKLKWSDKILLSKVGQNDYYKIAFVFDNKEYLSFGLKYQVSLIDINFISLNGKSPDDLSTKEFGLITTKSKAKELIATCDSKYYPDGVIDFMNELLT